ncbi:MAG: hypothetical protein ACKVQR_00770 [Aquabacterium sp.]
MHPEETTPQPAGMGLAAAADLQDHLMVATNDLDRLQRLLTDASETLMSHFHIASEHMSALQALVQARPDLDADVVRDVAHTLGRAVTALQFQDMASQLIAHTSRRLRACADRLANEMMGDDEDGLAVAETPPLRPNPVTQDEMDAGSIELF